MKCPLNEKKSILFFCSGPSGESERVEFEHEQADGPGHEDHPSHQQGGDGEQS